jgi:aspartyl-tRNA(Asn)/glutamyl-tRNA(Gln) amidotransferase subunit B
MDLSTFLETSLPELPEEARNRLTQEYGLSEYIATVLTGDPPAIAMFDGAVQVANTQLGEKEQKKVPETAANFLCNVLFALVRESEIQRKHDGETSSVDDSVQYSMVNGTQLGELVALVLEGAISNNMAKQILTILYTEDHGKRPIQVANDRGFKLITDADELSKLCHEVIVNHPEELDRYKMGGKFATKITKFYVGKAMAESHGNAHPERLNEVLLDVLEEVAPGVDR